MPLNTRQLEANIADVTFPYAGDTVTISYHPGMITKRFFAELEAAVEAASGDGTDVWAETICKVATKWDIVEHVQVPVTDANNDPQLDDKGNPAMRDATNPDGTPQMQMFPFDAKRVGYELPIGFLKECVAQMARNSGEATGTQPPKP